MENLVVTVENINGVLVTTSNRVAEELGVNHKNLLAKIDKYVKKFLVDKEFFIPSEYIHPQNEQQYRNYLITKKGMEMIIQHSCFTKAEQSEKAKTLYKSLGGNDVKTISVSTRFEISFVDMLEKALRELGVKGIRQYNVDNKYRIDFYIPSKNIAVEYDEKEHKYHEKEDIERENYIKDKLDCKFIRCDYKDEDIINIMKIIKIILGIDLNDIYIEGGNR